MINILKMDLRRMIRAKSTWIVLSCFVLIFLMTISTLSSKGTSALNSSGDYSVNLSSKLTYSSVFQFLVQGNMIALFILIFIGVFLNSERNNGYIKNIWGLVSRKSNIIFSKLIICAIYEIMLFVVLIGITFLGGKFLLHCSVMGNVKELFAFMLTQLLLNFSYSALEICLFTVINNSLVSMIVGISYVAIVAQLLFGEINMLIKHVYSSSSIKFDNYFVFGNLFNISMSSVQADYIRAIIVAVAWLAVALTISIFAIRRTEVK